MSGLWSAVGQICPDWLTYNAARPHRGIVQRVPDGEYHGDRLVSRDGYSANHRVVPSLEPGEHDLITGPQEAPYDPAAANGAGQCSVRDAVDRRQVTAK